jgi:hypothetical protein
MNKIYSCKYPNSCFLNSNDAVKSLVSSKAIGTLMLKRTPLYELHQQSGAKLVDFAGWEMPLHYGSQIEEHHYVRQHAGIFSGVFM